MIEMLRRWWKINFRGGNAPASLKLNETLHGVFKLALFPGWKRPGLIEAGVGLRGHQNNQAISGVETPRPH